MRALRLIVFAGAAAFALSGCRGCQPGPGDAGQEPVPPPPFPDAGFPPVLDAGPTFDAGPSFSGNYAGEACLPEWFAVDADSGLPEGAVPFGLCIVLRSFSGRATLNGKPASGDVQFEFESGNARGDLTLPPDPTGHFEAHVMRSRYDTLRYHPPGIFPTHGGPAEFGEVDLRQDRTRDLDVKSWSLRGNVSFAGIPWAASAAPDDVQLGAVGIPPAQAVSTTNQSGTYQVALLEGTFAIGVSVPRAALGETEILGWPVSPALVLTSDASLDINVPASQFSGQLTLDGQPYPDRRVGYDYTFEYQSGSAPSPNVRTVHEGGTPGFHALVPRETYGVRLRFDSTPDLHLPAAVYDKQLAAFLDLSHDATAHFALTTFNLEGAIAIDGQAPHPVLGFNHFLYAWAYAAGSTPAYTVYYEVPFVTAGLSLRAFPGTYYLALYLTDTYRPGLAEGYYVVDKAFAVTRDTPLVIDVWTMPLTGKLTIDGRPAPPGKTAGTLVFSGAAGRYQRRMVTADDGSYQVRVPKGTYDLSFQVDPNTFPEYAVGLQAMAEKIALEVPQTLDLDYQTVAVAGPIRVGGHQVPDTFPGKPEVGLVLNRFADSTAFQWTFGSGALDFVLRLPPGEYQPSFVIEREAIPGVADGHAPLGANLLVPARTY